MRMLRLLVLNTVCGFGSGALGAAEAEKPLPPVPLEDAVKLVKAGLSEEVLVAWAESLKPYAQVDAETIIKLKQQKVSENVIALLVRRGGTRAGEVREIGRYEVPSSSQSGAAREYLSKTDYVQAEARAAYTRDEAVRYTYVQPVRTIYVSSNYRYPASTYYSGGYYPYSYSGYYPSFRFSHGSSCRPYYSNRGYTSRCGTLRCR